MTEFVTPSDGPAQFAVWKRWVESQLSAMARPRSLQSASMAGGRIRILTGDGDDRVTLGQLGDGYGIEIVDENGEVVFRVDEDGMRRPIAPYPVRQVNPTPATVTGGSFASYWEWFVPRRVHDAIRVQVVVTKDSADEGEIRVSDGTFTSNVLVITSGWTQKRFTLDWAPGWTLNNANATQMVLQGRVTSGVDFFLFPPDAVFLTASSDYSATSGGAWNEI